MSFTVLFDLDDTLLANDMNAFLPVYLNGLGEYLSQKIDQLGGRPIEPDRIIRQVMLATAAMVAKTGIAETMESIFDRNFYPPLGLTKDQLRADIEIFYNEYFPEYRRVTQIRPKMVAAVHTCLERGYNVVIATNPLFPRQATRQRLAWAGLSVEENNFALVTTYEGFHFCKPNPAYYAEILAQLGWPEGGVVVIGDGLQEELLPASALGIPGFWINGNAAELERRRNELHPFCTAGTVDELMPWIDAMVEDPSTPIFDIPDATLAALKSSPAALDTLLVSRSDAVWRQRPAKEEWSVTEILCHLRDTDQEVHWPRVLKVCEEENPFMPGVITDDWAEERNYREQDGQQALADFTLARTQVTTLLEGLAAESWQRAARHAIFGPTTMLELENITVKHDQLHLRQSIETIRQIVG